MLSTVLITTTLRHSGIEIGKRIDWQHDTVYILIIAIENPTNLYQFNGRMPMPIVLDSEYTERSLNWLCF